MNRFRGFAVASLSMTCGLFLTIPANTREIAPTEDTERHFRCQPFIYRCALGGCRSATGNLGLTANVEELTVESNNVTGAVSTLSSQRGYLTDAAFGKPMDLAMSFIRSNVAALGLEASDLQDYVVSDIVYSRVTGATHIYLQQRHAGIPVYNAQLQVNVNRDGRIMSANNSFLPALAQSVRMLKPRMQSRGAVAAAAQFAGLAVPAQLRPLQSAAGPQQTTRLSHEGLSLAPINGRLMLLPIRRGEARLVWNFQIHTLDEQYTWDFTVDADTGQVWTRFDGTLSDQYRVYAQPPESPIHASPLPPTDARTLVVDPANSTASPSDGTTRTELRVRSSRRPLVTTSRLTPISTTTTRRMRTPAQVAARRSTSIFRSISRTSRAPIVRPL